MARITEKNTVVAIKEETSYAADPGPATAVGDCIAVLKGATYNNPYEDLASDDVVLDTFSQSESSRGAETSDITFPTPLVGGGRTSNIINAPEHSVLYKAGFGVENVLTANDTVGGSPTTNSFDPVTSAANFKVGDGIIIDITTSSEGLHVAHVVANNGTTVTYWPASTNAPALTDVVYTAANYRLASTAGVEGDLPSFFVDKWLNNDDHYEYFGQMIKTVTFDFAAGQHVNPTFATEGQKVVVTASDPHGFTGISYDVQTLTRMVAVNMQVVLDSASPVTFDCQNVQLTIENTLFDPRAVTTSGRSELVRTERKVTGSLEFFYESKQAYQDFKDETKFKLLLMAHGGGTDTKPVLGNSLSLYAPSVKLLSPSISVDNGIYKYTIPFECLMTNGGDEIFASFL